MTQLQRRPRIYADSHGLRSFSRIAIDGQCMQKAMGGRSVRPPRTLRLRSGQAVGVRGYGVWIFFTLRSLPVISWGSGISSIPRIVGEMSRREPPGFRVNWLAFSETTMNGTGFVV